MEEDIREKIALKRYQIISPVLAEPARAQNEYLPPGRRPYGPEAFSTSETISSLTLVLKEAFLSYGIPKRLYVDNAASFSSALLARSCALAGISLIHSKPYDSPSRGKVERLFRTIRERFLSGLQERISLDELNEAFWLWLQEDYHHKLHTGIGERPIDRYNASALRVPIRRLSKTELDEIFFIRHERVVNNPAWAYRCD